MSRSPQGQAPPSKARAIFTILGAANLGAWAWALIEARNSPALLGLAFLVYGLGLRHAFDADHIAAIDNVTRNLARDGVAPLTVGLWFALGHSTIVALATAGAALAFGPAQKWIPAIRAFGGVGGTLISASFLFAIAAANLDVARRLLRARAGRGQLAVTEAPIAPAAPLLASLVARVRRAPAMFAVGLLFGLGFDTASEVALIGISAARAAQPASPVSIMLYPALFAAGMSLADTLDGVLMARACRWAQAEPRRKLDYNLTVTVLSAGAALAIGAVQLAKLLTSQLQLKGTIWSLASSALDHSAVMGGLMTAVLLGWLAWVRRRRGGL